MNQKFSASLSFQCMNDAERTRHRHIWTQSPNSVNDMYNMYCMLFLVIKSRHRSFFLTLCEEEAWQSSLPSGPNNKLSFHMATLPFASLSPLPWCSADVAIGAWDPNKVRSGAMMSWYPISAVRPETDPFCKNTRWERKRGACGVSKREHTLHTSDRALNPIQRRNRTQRP